MQDIIIVSGFGRCGTSVTMQMLKAAGLDVLGKPPAFEIDETDAINFQADWVAKQYGKVLKILIPKQCNLIPSNYKFIWCHRDPFECAASQAKFGEIISQGLIKSTPNLIMKFYHKNVKDEPLQMNYLTKLGSVCVIRFEDIIRTPKTVSEILADYLNKDFDIEKMANVVLFRDVKCQPNLNIEMGLVERENGNVDDI